MAQKVAAPMPPNMDITSSYQLVWTALDPTSGAVVSGVNISNAAMLVTDNIEASGAGLAVGPFMLVPGPAA